MTVPMPVCCGRRVGRVVIAFPLLVLAGSTGSTRQRGRYASVMAVAAVICPAAVERVWAVRVADGAHALDRAVLRRIAVQLHMDRVAQSR